MWVPTGHVTPSPTGPYVEQVGWGPGRSMARLLRRDLLPPGGTADGTADEACAEEIGRAAEREGHALLVSLAGRRVLAMGLLDLPGSSYALLEAVPGAHADGVLDALLVRALHDAAAASVPALRTAPDHPAPLAGWAAYGAEQGRSGRSARPNRMRT